ncbi:response regulator [Colwellia sp. 4_MG-2023]|uniref:response regulator n=1 Tax=unclassified Colwellia TaxID=196834 RepID=UPI001C08910A|nr:MULTISPECIES: response regulator [unclassified Colwellia]MBU2926550.1 response regulator [Colwellia sp. C2M11]MDO6507581.1 response regulator [Colwellia sp. 5_MG-2023]MDO6556416.1 response regulator [Colwellia sp. 4_MG-2023]MDO6652588.1 response regulator [Colwellia sp. 3_MG-2023]MDO6665189.1 response regulator [Colwellia sp. 2_MG-2023]
MSTKLLICDDSNMARKQLARSLPDGWDVEVSFATNGIEGIEAIKENKGDVLLLDLNMPKMDGYQVLEAILAQDLPTLTIVVSGDIQPEAHKKVIGLGALAFIQKPVNKDKLTEVLLSYGLFTKDEQQNDLQDISDRIPTASKPEPTKSGNKQLSSPQANTSFTPTLSDELTLAPSLRDCYQEIANVAMGRAGDLLARLLDVFVKLPIPNVNFIEVSELRMALGDVESNESTSGVCQGFISAGISGEALLILNDSSFKDVASLMNYQYNEDEGTELELLMDLSNVLIGACLKGISEQLDINFSQGHPVVLGQHRKISELIANNVNKWKKTLAIEISYSIESYEIKCDLLLLFTEQSMRTLNNKLTYLLE